MIRPELVFISLRFLFPAHSGGAIRTGQILRGMKGGRFSITLLSPASDGDEQRYSRELAAVCDRFCSWRALNSEDRGRLAKVVHLFSGLPVSVAADDLPEARAVVSGALARKPTVVVADFVHAAVLLPDDPGAPSVLFTHNCEAEILERHAERAESRLVGLVWRSQAAKMRRFERSALRRFDLVVAVAERDAQRFKADYGVTKVATIPTGVDLAAFHWHPPDGGKRIVFTGSMDWLANVDGIEWMMQEVWPLVAAEVPDATMTVIGKAPPQKLVELAARLPRWEFAGRVPDIRPLIAGADAFVIPLRVGGGTRIKAFEAMAAGVPVVSTTLGVEGLNVLPGRHYLRADGAKEFGRELVRLLRSIDLGRALSAAARRYVDEHCSDASVARTFESLCTEATRLHTHDTAEFETSVGARA